VCLGENALRFPEEALRLLVVPQVFALLALAVALTSGRFSTVGGIAFQRSLDVSRSISDRGSPHRDVHSYNVCRNVLARCRTAFGGLAAATPAE
jgi:hypothetical protein